MAAIGLGEVGSASEGAEDRSKGDEEQVEREMESLFEGAEDRSRDDEEQVERWSAFFVELAAD
eukprot:6199602-Pyramimonas_sp.AAC.1